MEDKKDKKIIVISKQDHALFKKIAAEEGYSMRAMFSILLENYFKNYQFFIRAKEEIHLSINDSIGKIFNKYIDDSNSTEDIYQDKDKDDSDDF